MAATAPTLVQIDAAAFAAALRSGIHRVVDGQEELNAINVFPVPDGDTGTNLSLSLTAALGRLDEQQDHHIGRLLARLADDLLDGSRGNSGAIIAQFFQGLSDSAETLERLDPPAFASAVELGSRYAHDAIENPKEGTILSVIAAFASALGEQLRTATTGDFAAALRVAMQTARDALARTPDQLAALRKAGVVDAGAQGFVELIRGMTDYLVDGVEVEPPDLSRLVGNENVIETAGETEDLGFRYCTECIVTGADIDRRKLREKLSALGNSLVLAGTKRKAKIHIHVNDPSQVFETVAKYGKISNQKADDMQVQQASTHATAARFAVITDSAADIPDELLEALDIHLVPMRVQFGERGFLDKVSITPDEFFRELERNPVHPTTSQPSPGDFRRQFQYLASHFPDVVSLSVTGTVSGTLQAAKVAADRLTASGRVHVLDTLNASLGQGLLVILAAECAAAGRSFADTLATLDEAVRHTKTFAVVRDLRYAVRGGRVPASRKLIADLLRVTPVLSSTADGRISSAGVLPGRRGVLPRFARYIARHSAREPLDFLVGHANAPDDARRLANELASGLGDARCRGVTSVGTAIGTHAGPGALVVAVQRRFDHGANAG